MIVLQLLLLQDEALQHTSARPDVAHEVVHLPPSHVTSFWQALEPTQRTLASPALMPTLVHALDASHPTSTEADTAATFPHVP